jgi:hypothetical protein
MGGVSSSGELADAFDESRASSGADTRGVDCAAGPVRVSGTRMGAKLGCCSDFEASSVETSARCCIAVGRAFLLDRNHPHATAKKPKTTTQDHRLKNRLKEKRSTTTLRAESCDSGDPGGDTSNTGVAA